MNCTIEVITADGQRYSSNVSAIKGNPLNPMSIEECMEKFRKCVDYSSKRIAKEKVSEILHILEDLENLKNIRILMDLLR
jgi:2-methylcitrate dehydratase PrpD